MNPGTDSEVALSLHPQHLAKLINKLRWIGMEDEAHRLEVVMSLLPPEQRGIVSAGPICTD